jgi:hypothetical protein
MKVELQPWITPNYVSAVMPPQQRQDGFNPDAAPKWHVKDLNVETLAEQCDKFRAEVFKLAGKDDPAKPHTNDSSILLDNPPSDGYRPTTILRWVRSATHGGTVLAQLYDSTYVGEDSIWCIIPHGLPADSTNQ